MMPVDQCGMAIRAALEPKEAFLRDGPDPSQTERPSRTYTGPGPVYRSAKFCGSRAERRLLVAAVGTMTVLASTLAVACVFRDRRQDEEAS